MPITCDATDPGQVAAMAAEAGSGLDVLVNMAGGNTDFARPARQDTTQETEQGPMHEGDLKDVAAAWRANLDANLLSAVLTTTAVLGSLRAGGSIINVGSIGAEYASTSYGAAKAALAAWTAGLSAEVGPTGPDRQRDLARLHRGHRLLPRQAHRAAADSPDRRHP